MTEEEQDAQARAIRALLRTRSLSTEVRHMIGTVAFCVAPWAYAFGYLRFGPFWFVILAAATLLVSTVPPGPRIRR